MKKIFTSFIAAMFLIVTSFSGAKAMNYEESYQAAQSYYQKKTTLQSSEEVIACEAIGVDSSRKQLAESVVVTDKASDVSKTIIALILHGDDPRNYQGVNYVEKLEKAIQENGAVYFENEVNGFGANNQVYNVYALYVLHSNQLTLATDYLASMIDENGAFGFAGGYADASVTGWTIEALSLVNKTKYQSTIEKAMTYLSTLQKEDASYDGYGYGADANTQASILMGLLTYDENGVKSTTYNKGENNPYTVLLTFQNSDGSFWSSFQGEGVEDYFPTVQGIQTIGYYYHGSVYKTAYQKYQKLLESKTEEPTSEKEVEKTPVYQKETKPVNKDKKKVVETADLSDVLGYLILLGLSIVGIRKGRKNFE